MVDAWSCEADHVRLVLSCVACMVMAGSQRRVYQSEDLNCTPLSNCDSPRTLMQL